MPQCDVLGRELQRVARGPDCIEVAGFAGGVPMQGSVGLVEQYGFVHTALHGAYFTPVGKGPSVTMAQNHHRSLSHQR